MTVAVVVGTVGLAAGDENAGHAGIGDERDRADGGGADGGVLGDGGEQRLGGLDHP